MRAFRIAVLGIALLVGSQSAYAVCVGDCNNNNKVAVNELVVGVNIALDRADLDTCPSFDPSSNGKVEVNELVLGVNNLLRDSCPVVPTPTPTATITVTPTPTAILGTAICNFDEAADNSNLQLFVGGNTDLSGLVTNIAGAIEIKCDPATQDVNGKRVCTCELQTWSPPTITGIGFICIDPGPPCPTGEVDCDGGNALGLEAEDSSQIGACTTHAGCSTDCDTHCATLSKVQWRSGCENICQGGTRDNMACICDVFNGAGCTGGVAGVNDCPGGSCVGKNNETDQDCQCQCYDYAAGGAGPAGALQCNLSSDIKVVASLPCTNPALVDLPPICAPFSSQTVTGITSPANEGTSLDIGPNTLNGASETCTNFDASVTTGYTLVGDFGFFDSTVGDLRTPFTVDCQ